MIFLRNTEVSIVAYFKVASRGTDINLEATIINIISNNYGNGAVFIQLYLIFTGRSFRETSNGTLLGLSRRYLSKHTSLRPHMRMILIEWLVSLQSRYKLLQETLLMTVSILDRFMSDTSFEVSRSKFQLVGKNRSRIAISNTYFISGSTFALYKCGYNLGSEKRFNHLMAVISTERYFASFGCTFLRVYQ